MKRHGNGPTELEVLLAEASRCRPSKALRLEAHVEALRIGRPPCAIGRLRRTLHLVGVAACISSAFYPPAGGPDP